MPVLVVLLGAVWMSTATARYYCERPIGGAPDPDQVAWLPWRSYCGTEQSMPSSPDYYIIEDYPQTDIADCAELGAERQRQNYQKVYPDCAVTTTDIYTYTLDEAPLACNGNVDPHYYIGFYIEAYEGTWQVACPGFPPSTNVSNFGSKYYLREPVGRDERVDAKNLGQPLCGLAAGNPINIATGNKYQRRQDISFPGGLQLVRHYNSADSGQYGFGSGWRGSFSRRIDFIATSDHATLSLVLTRDDGRADFWRIEAASVVPPPDARGRLEAAYIDGRIAGFTYREGTLLETYGPQGRLQTVENDRGDRLVLTHEEGILAAVTDATGRRLAYSRDSSGRVIQVTADDGTAWAYAYDETGRLLRVVHPGGVAETYHYENPAFPNALTGVSDERGNRVRSWAYDDNGRAVLSIHGDLESPVERFSIVYNPDGSTTTTGPLQHSVEHQFQVDHGVVRFALASAPCESCANRAQSTVRDEHGNRDIVTDFRGFSSDYDYSADNLLLKVTEALGTPQEREVNYQWDSILRKPTRITRGGMTTDFTYNSRGQVLSRTITDVPSQAVRSWTYSYFEPPSVNGLVGKLKSIDGPRVDVDDRTVYEYYDNDHAGGDYRTGDLKAVINPLGHRTTWLKYDANGRPLLVSDANNVPIALSWGPRGWLRTRSVADATTRFDYDEAGNLLRLTRPDGTFLEHGYDELNRLVAVADNLGNRIEYTLDSKGNRIAEETVDAAGELRRSLSRQYDALGRLSALIDGMQAETLFGYDDQRNLVNLRDANGNLTTFAHDALGRLIGTIDASLGESHTVYDRFDRPVRITDPLGNVTEYGYDGLGNRIQLSSPDSGSSDFEYDAAGNRTAATDARGIRRDLHYDALGRLTWVSFPDSSLDIRFEYDEGSNGVGRLTGMTDAAGTVDYRYDRHGNLIGETRHIGPHAYETAFAYDTAGRLVQIHYPGGLVVDQLLDASGRVAALVGPGGVLAEDIQYEPFGPIRSFSYGNGLRYTAEFDPNYAVRQIQSGPTLDWTIDRDAVGNLLAIGDGMSATLDQAFAYDERHRLLAAQGAYGSLSFDLDVNGNRTSRRADSIEEVLGYENGSNRLLSHGRWHIGRDASGNRTQKLDDGGSGQTSQYAGHGRLARILAVNGGSEVALGEYVYDGLGRRVIKYADARTTHFIYGPTGRLLGEYVVGGGTDEREYVYLEGAPIAVVTRKSEWRSPPGLDRIVDNGDAGTSGTGNWRTKSGRQAWGADYLFANRARDSQYRWSTTLPVMAYRLYAWWSDKNNQSADVTYTIFDGSGSAHSVTRSHKNGGGRWQLLGEYHSMGGENSVEVRSGSNRFVADSVRWAEITQPVEVVNETRHYLHFDHLATPRRVTDQGRTVVWRWDSTPFGLAPPNEDPDGDGQAFTLNLRFAGQYHDEESGLSYNRFRTYDPETGRFLEADPVGLEGGLNAFVYALDDPMGLVDPQGLMPVGEWMRQPKFNITDYGLTDLGIIAPRMNEWGFLKVFRIRGYASGYVNLDVLCRESGECARREWEVHESIGLSYSGYKDFGPNMVAAGAGTTAGPLAGAATGILTFGGAAMTALLEMLREVDATGGDKIRWLYELGPTAICLGSR